MKQFKTETKRILDLMINSIYTNKEIFLRELISNASDAIDKLKFISLTDGSVCSDFKIEIEVDKQNRTLTIKDNGIGMTDKDMEKNLGTIAESGTLAFKNSNEQTKGELIGQFGVGFYSAFMVADKIEVKSKAFGQTQAFIFVSEGAEGYSINSYEKQDVGTEITLYLKQDNDDFNYSQFLEQYKIASLVKQYSDYIRYPIQMTFEFKKKIDGSPEDNPQYASEFEVQTLNSMIPLWKKPKKDVDEKELSEFYKKEFHDYNQPIYSVYAKIEGLINYDTLLFVPEKAPFNYYSKDYKKGIKLYCNGVMIMEKCEELLPDYLGFFKGIVDSSDLSLNISREILQQDRQVKNIAQSLEKKILSELNKTLKDDREKFEKIFNEFGLTLKFGAYANFGRDKDKLKDLLMFYSDEKQALITLAEYVQKMKEGQEFIYYACGGSYEQIKALPKVEAARANGTDVLLLKDDVDEFVVKIIAEYEGKKFKSVGDADVNFSSESSKDELDKSNTENKQLLDEIKCILDGKVNDVKFSLNLNSYPACLTSSGEISIEMEKVLNAMPGGQGNIKAEKILEINLNHSVTEKIKNVFKNDKQALKNYAIVLYNQARLLEGLPIENVSEFVLSMGDIL